VERRRGVLATVLERRPVLSVVRRWEPKIPIVRGVWEDLVRALERVGTAEIIGDVLAYIVALAFVPLLRERFIEILRGERPVLGRILRSA